MEGLLSIIIPSYNEGLLIDNTANVVVEVWNKNQSKRIKKDKLKNKFE